MRGVPIRIWTCDKCGRTETVDADSAPKNWRHVSSQVVWEIRRGADKQYDGQWCPGCVEATGLLP